MGVLKSILDLLKGGLSNLLSTKTIAAIVSILVTLFGLDISSTQQAVLCGFIGTLWVLVTGYQAGKYKSTPQPKLSWMERIQALFTKEFIGAIFFGITTLAALPASDALQADVVAAITSAFMLGKTFINVADIPPEGTTAHDAWVAEKLAEWRAKHPPG